MIKVWSILNYFNRSLLAHSEISLRGLKDIKVGFQFQWQHVAVLFFGPKWSLRKLTFVPISADSALISEKGRPDWITSQFENMCILRCWNDKCLAILRQFFMDCWGVLGEKTWLQRTQNRCKLLNKRGATAVKTWGKGGGIFGTESQLHGWWESGWFLAAGNMPAISWNGLLPDGFRKLPASVRVRAPQLTGMRRWHKSC